MHPDWGTGRDKPTGNTKGVKKLKMRKITGNKKGIDTILAALLMVVIVVVAAVMVYAWSTGLLGTLLVNPNNNKEGPLTADNSVVCGPSGCTNATINIRNAGSLSVTLTAYYITDSNGDQWSVTSWSTSSPTAKDTSLTIAPNQVVPIFFVVGSGCSPSTSCTYTPGSGSFSSFTTGSYTVKVVTSRNNPFTFTITK